MTTKAHVYSSVRIVSVYTDVITELTVDLKVWKTSWTNSLFDVQVWKAISGKVNIAGNIYYNSSNCLKINFW